ncbi:MAG: hypothetical protein QG620_558 [Patescibacteria group bacterium]|nr:hypothetical protein [Patescibacteria group bacterium]
METLKKVVGIFLCAALGFLMGTPFVTSFLLNLFRVNSRSDVFGMAYYYGFPLLGLAGGLAIGAYRARK